MPGSPMLPRGEAAVAQSSLPSLSRRRRPALILAAIGIGVYTLALGATLPARAVLPAATDAAGTVWHGEAALPAGAVARWDWSLARSLGRGGLAGAWMVDGPGTMLAGGARWRPFVGADLDAVHGAVAWPFLAAVVPGLPPGCTIGVRVELAKVDLGRARQGARGTADTASGVCTSEGPGVVAQTPRAVPRLVMSFDGAHGIVAPWTNRAQVYADLSIANNVLHLRTTALGATVLPGAGRASDVEIAL